VSRDYLLERRREDRLSRFGMALGLFISLVLFIVLFSFSFVKYEPILEKARVKRVLVARPYRPRAVQPKKKPGGSSKTKAQNKSRPKPKAKPPRRPPKPSKAPVVPLKKRPLDKIVKPKPTKTTKQPQKVRKPDEDNVPEADAADVNSLLSALESRNAELEELGDAPNTGVVGDEDSFEGLGNGVGSGEGDGEGYLDPRITINVVSYPKTSIEDSFPEIEYPDLRFKRKQLQAGICRVYYRVWTDNMGRIVKDQLKTPSTQEDLEKYSVFIDAVKSSVKYWVFDKVEADIHIDVLFEIE